MVSIILESLLKCDRFTDAINYISEISPKESIDNMVKLYLIKAHLHRVIELRQMLHINYNRNINLICRHLTYVANLLVDLKEY